MTILLVSPWGMGGTIRSALNLAGYLVEQGWDVEILGVFRTRDKPFFGPFSRGVRARALDDRRPGRRRGLRGRVAGALAARPSVLVHPQDRMAGASSLWTDVQLVRALRGRTGFLMGTRPGLNFLVAELAPPGCVLVGLEQMNLGHHAAVLKEAMRETYYRLDVLAVLTEGDRRAYHEHLGPRAPRVEVIPNTVRPMGGDPADLSAKVVLAAGRLRLQKGFDMLVRAWAQVAPERPDWRLRICGKGRLRGDLKALIAEHGLEGSVSLEGPSAQLGRDMARSSVFALSSRFEGFPLILLEAMSKRMAVVAFDCPTGPADIVDDHRNGILVPPKDVGAFAAGLLEMTGDEALRRRCAEAAVPTAERFTMEQVGPRWEALFADLWAQRPAGAGAGR